jgi:hypothetical protein
MLAQESSLFEISIIPQHAYAVAGHPFTYTVVITNVSSQPLSKILVKANTPEESTFSGTTFADTRWGVRGVEPGENGEIFWLTWETIDPGEVVAFELTVDVLPGFEQALIIDDYFVALDHADNIMVRGVPVTTNVLLNFPTATPYPTPTLQNTVTHLTTPSDETPVAQITATPSDTGGRQKETTNIYSIIIVLGFIIVLIVLGRLFWHRSRH